MFEHIDMTQPIENNQDNEKNGTPIKSVSSTDKTLPHNSSQKIDSTPDVKIYTVIAGAFILTVFILLIILWKFRNRKARGNKNE